MRASDLAVHAVPSPVKFQASRAPTASSKLGMWTFLLSDAITLATLLVSCALLRVESQSWPVPSHVLHAPLTGIMTCLLLASSSTMVRSQAALAQGNLSRFKTYLLLTIVGGLLFILSQAWEWFHLFHQGLTLTTNPWGTPLFGSSFYLLTGFHGAHVVAGLVYLTVIFLQGLRGVYHTEYTTPVFLGGLYWYFVDACWFFILPVVYFP